MSDSTNQPVFDITQFEAVDTAVMEATDASGDPLMYGGNLVTFELYGPGSEQYAKAQSEIDAANQTRTFAAIRGKTIKDGPGEVRRLNAKKLAACTRQINNFPVVPIDLYMNPKMGYLTGQVVKYIEDWANFKPASTTN